MLKSLTCYNIFISTAIQLIWIGLLITWQLKLKFSNFSVLGFDIILLLKIVAAWQGSSVHEQLLLIHSWLKYSPRVIAWRYSGRPAVHSGENRCDLLTGPPPPPPPLHWARQVIRRSRYLLHPRATASAGIPAHRPPTVRRGHCNEYSID